MSIIGQKSLGTCVKVYEVDTDPRTNPHDIDAGMIVAFCGGPAPVWFAKLDNGSTTNVEQIVLRNNQLSVSAPSATDDITAGYSFGSKWYNSAGDEVYMCVSAALGAAIWKQIS